MLCTVLSVSPQTARAETWTETQTVLSMGQRFKVTVEVTLSPAAGTWSSSKELKVRAYTDKAPTGIGPGKEIELYLAGNDKLDAKVIGKITQNNFDVTGTYTMDSSWNGQKIYMNVEVYGETFIQATQFTPKIDGSAPNISSVWQNTGNWATQKTISANVADSESGVASVSYSGPQSGSMSRTSGNAASGTWTSGNLTATGTYTITARDNAGRTSSRTVTVNNIDRTGPSVTNGKQTITNWSKETKVSATVTDSQSGVSQVIWSTNSGATSGNAMNRSSGNASSGTYTSTGTVTKNGTYYIRAKDAVGNWSGTQAVNVSLVDNTAPTISNVMLDPADGWVGSRTVKANITDTEGTGKAGCGIRDVFLTTNVDETDASKGIPLVAGSAGEYSLEMATEGTYYIVAYDNLGNRSRSSAIIIEHLDGEPPVMTGIRCKNTNKGFEVTFTLEDAITGVDNTTVKYGTDPATTGNGTIKYNSLKKEYSFVLPADGKDYWIFAADKAGHYMAPVQVPRLWLPHVTDTGEYTNDWATGEDIKSGEAEIETYGYIGNMPKSGVDLDEDGQVDAIAPAADMIDVTVPMNVMMYASWDNFAEKKNFVSPNSMVVNNNLVTSVKVEVTGFEPAGAGRTIDLLGMDVLKGENDIGVLVKPTGTGTVRFLPTDITKVDSSAPLSMGTLAGGEGIFYTFEGDYIKELVQNHKGESLVCNTIFRFSRG